MQRTRRLPGNMSKETYIIKKWPTNEIYNNDLPNMQYCGNAEPFGKETFAGLFSCCQERPTYLKSDLQMRPMIVTCPPYDTPRTIQGTWCLPIYQKRPRWFKRDLQKRPTKVTCATCNMPHAIQGTWCLPGHVSKETYVIEKRLTNETYNSDLPNKR